MTTLPSILLVSVPRLVLAFLLAVLPLAVSGDGARAQSGIDLSTENVTVDLSVIGEGAARAPLAGALHLVRPPAAGGTGGLLVPGPRNPVSRLLVAVPKSGGRSGITLKPPTPEKPKKPAKAAAKPKPKPKKKMVAEKKPPPEPTPAAKVAKVAKAPPAPPPAEPKPKKPAPSSAQSAAAAKPEPKKPETASLPPAKDVPKPGRAVRVAFGPTVSKLPADAKGGLKVLAKKLKGKKNLRLQLMAYAGGKGLSPSKARRLSLSRALSVRSFLIESGVRSTRIDVRALGAKTTEEPLNRVDVNIVQR